ncbi:MAG: hypothetical protein IT334_10260 [Thermomicrobiales bacterium]|nr:hypothetical protein [Thermomicrobiales bacterium]
MNVIDGLTTIKERLDEQGANEKTLKYLDIFIERAKTPGASNAGSPTLIQLMTLLMRNQIAQGNTIIYNDLARLEETLRNAASDIAARKAAEDARPVPKSKKYYKELKEKQAKDEQG